MSHRKGRRAAPEMKRLMALALFLFFALLPGLAYLWYSGLLGGEAFSAVPYEELLKERNIMRSRRLYVQDGGESGQLILPAAEHISVSLNVAEKSLYVRLEETGSRDEDEGQELSILADLSLVESAELYQQGGIKDFYFRLSQMCVAEWSVHATQLCIQLTELTHWEKHGGVLVLADGGGAGQIIVQTLLLLSESAPQLSVFPLQKDYADTEAFLALSGADVYVRLAVAEDEGSSAASYVSCNPDYFIPGLDSVLLADILEEKLLAQLDSPAGDIVPLDRGDMIRSFSIPACHVCLGWQEDEAGRHGSAIPGYEQAAAQGLADGLSAVFLLEK